MRMKYGWACINFANEHEEGENKEIQQQQQYILFAKHTKKRDMTLIYRVKNIKKVVNYL